MIIGVPKEIKDHETRVGLVPSGVTALREAGHEVLVETHAGEGSSLTDQEYAEAGASILATAAEVWQRADLIVKVKEPQTAEYGFFRADLILFTYLHLAPLPELTDKLVAAKVNGVAYETIRERDGSLPLLTPMSEVAGRMSVQVGAQYLERPSGGRGILLGGVPGVAPGNVVILGGGIVGTNAAKIAIGMGAHVAIIDRSLNRLRELDDIFNGQVVTLASNAWTISENLRTADLVVGAVLIPGRFRSPPGAPRDDLPDEARRRGRRCRDRPGRLLRNLPRHHPHRAHLFRRWRAPLLRLQHAGRRPPHVHAGTDQRHFPLPARTGEPRTGRRLPASRRAARRRQHI